MSGSRFIYILLLILLLFGVGGYAVQNWGTVKNYLSDEVSSAAENRSQEDLSLFDKIKKGARTVLYGSKKAGRDALPVDSSNTKNNIKTPVAAPSGAAAVASKKSATGPRFRKMRLARGKGSIFSGTAKPGWRVTVQSNGRSLGRTKANSSGDWMLIVEKPMRKQNYKFGVIARAPGSSKKIERGDDVALKFGPEDGPTKIITFSKTGIATVVLKKTARPAPGERKPGTKPAPSDKAETASEDDLTITAGLRKKAGELADAASEKFTEVLKGLKPEPLDEPKIALAPKTAPAATPTTAPKPAGTPDAKASDPVLKIDKTVDKASEIASDAKSAIAGYLDRLGLSGNKQDTSDKKPAVKPAQKKPTQKKPTARKSIAALSFDKVEMSDDGGRSGMLKLSGHAEPGAKIGIYLGRRVITSVTADAAGRWSFSGLRNIPFGKNRLRAIHTGKRGQVLARAEYSLRRVAPKTIVALKKPLPLIAPAKSLSAVTSTKPSASAKKPAPVTGAKRARYSAKPRAVSKARYKRRYRSAKKRKKRIRLAQARRYKRKYKRRYKKRQRPRMKLGRSSGIAKRAKKYRKRRAHGRRIRRAVRCGRGYFCYRVRRGDSLWKIAKRYYGNGRQYRRIYRANKGRIRNPNLIYTSQRICIKRR